MDTGPPSGDAPRITAASVESQCSMLSSWVRLRINCAVPYALTPVLPPR